MTATLTWPVRCVAQSKRLAGANFTEQNLTNANVYGATLTGADARGAPYHD
jgi:uncharacterized protein YjbI with pentapeptide repeats